MRLTIFVLKDCSLPCVKERQVLKKDDTTHSLVIPMQDIYLEEVPIQVNYSNANAYAWNSKVTGVRLFGDPTQILWGIMDWKKAP